MAFYANCRRVSHIRRIAACLLLVSIGITALQTPVTVADSAIPSPGWGTFVDMDPDTGTLVFFGSAGALSEKEAKPDTLKTIFMYSTAYTSRAQETDGSPFVTADGSAVRDGVVATNILPFGTKVRLPTVFGDRIFTVHDRMNARYSYKIDVWASDLATAKRYGVKRNIPVEVVAWGDNKTQWAARTEMIKQEHVAKQEAQGVAKK